MKRPLVLALTAALSAPVVALAVATPAAPRSAATLVYTVQTGDTLYHIA